MPSPDSTTVWAPGTETHVATHEVPLTVFRPEEVTKLLQAVSKRRPGAKTGLDRDTARSVLTQLSELQRHRRGIPNHVFCPYCRHGFDSAHSRVHPEGPKRPPRHPDPIASSGIANGAAAAATALTAAAAVDDLRQRDFDSFWLALARTVVWPLLYVSRATGRTMDQVEVWLDPRHLDESLVDVSAVLASLDPSAEVKRVRRQWQAVADLDTRPRRAAFDYAFGAVRYWQATRPRSES
jgi:hypothetical protein